MNSEQENSECENATILTIRQHIKSYPDFPKKGVLFQDIFSVLQQPEVFSALCNVLLNHCRNVTPKVECIVALESRGFLFGPLIALNLKVPFVPVRKRGKLPGKLLSVTYELEYGQDVFEMQEGAIKANANVLVVDDLLATGGSLAAACKLIKQSGGNVAECLCVIEITHLNGRCQLSEPFHSILQY